MTRGTVIGLGSPHPMIEALPGIYQEDDFARDLLDALDVVLAPIISSVDNLVAYLDPWLAPEDFLDWLAGWVAAAVDETWSLDQRRRFVAAAATLHRRRGTVAGMREHLTIFTDGVIEISEPGSVSWSPTPGTPLPPPSAPAVHVRVLIRPGSTLDLARLDALVAAAKPAHLAHTVEIQPLARRSAPPAGPQGDAPAG